MNSTNSLDKYKNIYNNIKDKVKDRASYWLNQLKKASEKTEVSSNQNETQKKENPLENYNSAMASNSAGAGLTAPTAASEASANTPSNQFSAKYQGTDFLEWYKANYGKNYDSATELARREGMSDVDWDIGNSLYDTYRNDQQRKSDYESRVSALDKSKTQAQQSASITLDKLKKYLPTQIKAQGLGGLGVSESSLLNAYNNYSSDMGAIENDYQDRKSSLEEAYAQDNLNSWKTSKDSVSGIFDGYKTQFENNQKQAYQDAYNTISQSSEKDENALLKYIEQFKNRLSDSDYLTLTQQAKQVAQTNKEAYEKEIGTQKYNIESQNLGAMYESMISDDGKISQADYDKLASYIEERGAELGDSYKQLLNAQLNGYKTTIRDSAKQAELDKQTALKTPTVNNDITIKGKLNTANDDYGDNFKISYDGTTYKVEKGYDASDNLNRKLIESYTQSTGATPALGSVMVYDGKIYMYLTNNEVDQDRWCVVQQRQNSYADHFKNLCNALKLTVYSRGFKDSE